LAMPTEPTSSAGIHVRDAPLVGRFSDDNQWAIAEEWSATEVFIFLTNPVQMHTLDVIAHLANL
jgi:multisubunit Na+/H+ antiporter MnhG subunit